MASFLTLLFHVIFDMVQSLSGNTLLYAITLPSLLLYENSELELSTYTIFPAGSMSVILP